LVTVVDRKSKFTLIDKVQSKHADRVTKALINMLTPIKPILKTITSDNGKEFAYHKIISNELDTNFYFAHPYHSWERGLNEHTNGLIRQYLPKKQILQRSLSNKSLLFRISLITDPERFLHTKLHMKYFFKILSKRELLS